jgi:hypothetical protein
MRPQIATYQLPQRVVAAYNSARTTLSHVNRQAVLADEIAAPPSQRPSRCRLLTSSATIDGITVSPSSDKRKSIGTFQKFLVHTRPRPVRGIAPVAHQSSGSADYGLIGGGIRQSDAYVGMVSNPGIPGIESTFRPMVPRSLKAGPREDKEKGSRAGEGDLYLEGAAMGRWLTQYLGQEFARPRSGIMGVDPRITPSWGGPSLAT